MLLTLDIGNTSITIGLFDGDSLAAVKRMPSNILYSTKKYESLLLETLGQINISGCMIASVVNGLDKTLMEAVESVFGVESVVLNPNLNLGLTLKLRDNNEIGADRIANGVAAKLLYKTPAIVVDFGTANTFDIVNAKGEFIGGIIAPGINTQLTALSNSTSKLPNIDIMMPNFAIGDNTVNAILSGVIRGTACMVDGMLAQCEQELGEKATIIATGGLSETVAKYMSRKFDVINPTLTLEGLKELYKLNPQNAHLQHQAL